MMEVICTILICSLIAEYDITIRSPFGGSFLFKEGDQMGVTYEYRIEVGKLNVCLDEGRGISLHPTQYTLLPYDRAQAVLQTFGDSVSAKVIEITTVHSIQERVMRPSEIDEMFKEG
jgi:hypothetical protein